MEFNLFIAPITMIVVEMFKTFGLDKKYLAFVAVIFGALFGAIYGFIYKGDIFTNAFEGMLYGASASGLWDAATKTLKGA